MGIKDLPPVLTPERYAELTDGNARSVRIACQRGRLPATKIGQRWYISTQLVFKELMEQEALSESK